MSDQRRCKDCSQKLPPAPRIGRPPILCEDCSHPPKRCETCGKQFRAKPERRFCSQDCSSKRNLRPSQEKLWKACETCGTPFRPKANQRYCDAECREKSTARRTPPLASESRPNRLCYECRRPFRAVGVQKYCSPKCRNARPEIPCRHCRSLFQPGRGQLYCTPECRRAHNAPPKKTTRSSRSPRDTVNCEVCGSLFVKRSPTHRFCGKACAEQAHPPKGTCRGCGAALPTPRKRTQWYCNTDCRKVAIRRARKKAR